MACECESLREKLSEANDYISELEDKLTYLIDSADVLQTDIKIALERFASRLTLVRLP